jgi:hypothetical protein
MAGMLRPAPNRSPSANLTCWSCLPYNPEMVYCIDTKHCTMVPSTVDMYIQATHTAARLAINLSPPNLPPTFTPGPEVQDGLGANARNSWPSLSRVCHSFNRLGIHSRSSSSASATKPIPDLPALPPQPADARSQRFHLAWRQPAPMARPSRDEKQSSLPWRLYGVACLLSYILTATRW